MGRWSCKTRSGLHIANCGARHTLVRSNLQTSNAHRSILDVRPLPSLLRAGKRRAPERGTFLSAATPKLSTRIGLGLNPQTLRSLLRLEAQQQCLRYGAWRSADFRVDFRVCRIADLPSRPGTEMQTGRHLQRALRAALHPHLITPPSLWRKSSMLTNTSLHHQNSWSNATTADF